MAKKITSLSSGYAVKDVIKGALGSALNGIYPVVSRENAKMPYLVYYRENSASTATKTHTEHDTATLVLEVYSTDYGESVSLIEDVRQAIEGRRIHYTDDDDPELQMTVDCSRVIDSAEEWAGDSYLQRIIIECKVN